MVTWREPIVQLVALIVAMLVVSFLNVAWVSAVLAQVRAPLLLALLVAVSYQVWLARPAGQVLAPIAQDDSPLLERERGAA